MQEIFLKQRAPLGASHVPSQPLTVPSPRGMPSRDSRLPLDRRNIAGTSRKVFESLPTRDGPSSALFENSLNLASSPGNTLEHERGVRREPQSSSIPAPRFQMGSGISNHTGGTHSHIGMMDYPRFPISEMHLGKFPDSKEFQSYKVSVKTEVCSMSPDPHNALDRRSRESKVN